MLVDKLFTYSLELYEGSGEKMLGLAQFIFFGDSMLKEGISGHVGELALTFTLELGVWDSRGGPLGV